MNLKNQFPFLNFVTDQQSLSYGFYFDTCATTLNILQVLDIRSLLINELELKVFYYCVFSSSENLALRCSDMVERFLELELVLREELN